MKKIKMFLIGILALSLITVFAYKLVLKIYYPIKYYNQVEIISRDNDLPIGLVFSVIHTESGFDSSAESIIGARGLMQITEETFDWISYRMNDKETKYEDLYDPNINIQYGGWLLRLLLDEFDTFDNALSAYHAGWGSASNWLNSTEYAPDGKNITNIPYRDTKYYLYKVNKTWKKYNKIYNFDDEQ